MLRSVAPADRPPIAFDVVDVLDGFATLVKRSPVLDGSVALRVAQACAPLLEGNAWGAQLAIRPRIELRRRFGRWSVASDPGGEDRARLLRGAIPMLVADGTLRPGAWQRRLEHGVIDTRGGISVFTGLFVRPRPGVRVRQSRTANRRSFAFSIEEAILDDPDGFCPVVLEVVPEEVDGFALEGEIATLGALPDRVAVSRCGLAGAPGVAAAHLRFYDGEYFATKQRGAVARKYRDQIARRDRQPAREADPVEMTIVDSGPVHVVPAAPARVHRAAGPVVAPATTPPDRCVVRNAVGFTAVFDGVRVAVEPDRDELAAYAREVRACWERWLADAGVAAHAGALLYLTKYFTSHPPGEPHFFTKPCALIRTSPGCSTVIDGHAGAAYDVLRGVVRTDTFHAAPAVFQLWQPGRPIRVPRGAALAELFACPRELTEASFASVAGGPTASWAT